MKKQLRFVFYSLILIFIILVIYFVAPFSESIKQASFPVMFIFGGLFFIMGIVLSVLTIKSKEKKKLKIFLLLTGLSAISFLLGVVLHNLLYALATIINENQVILKFIVEALHVTFFIIATLGCPIAFLIGMIGTIILLRKKN